MKLLKVLNFTGQYEHVVVDSIQSIVEPSGRVHDSGHITLKSGAMITLGQSEGQAKRLVEELKRLEDETDGMRKSILNQQGDNLCWFSDPEQVKALPAAEFLESCRRYYLQISAQRGVATGLKTIAQLEAEVAILRGAEWVPEIPATLCEHANECPAICRCPPNCYCRRVGSAPACKKREPEPATGKYRDRLLREAMRFNVGEITEKTLMERIDAVIEEMNT